MSILRAALLSLLRRRPAPALNPVYQALESRVFAALGREARSGEVVRLHGVDLEQVRRDLERPS